jgi:hypothetical protein
LEKFKAEDAASSMSWFATIPLDGGPPTSVSWVQGSLANPTHREVYAFREYGATDIIIQRPRGARNCP